ncbi:MFS transporter [Novosphingobium sp. Gsoil 351]|uniref:spinster family MFS transporter n=1 Tax=Novosphingobium sp. Gsoil 351 TaxID=2675225 RepID=UPI0012B4E00D|nr:MFS transporter [Novosphingobium sp. Gsoil 351]QGN53997.1 MFS transporter [Novosphingobium sp. Gsoil 351]
MTILTLALALNFVDRQVINILAEPIRYELDLADWQIGLMSGMAFALLYGIAGIPFARLADRGHRPRIMAVAVLAWSGFTIACSFAMSFPQLLLGRVGVGVGEAGLTPAANSLIVDYFPAERRASALSIYYLGVPLGSLAGLALGGLVADAYGWRTAFLVAGLPGLLIAPLLWIGLHEPRTRFGQRTETEPGLLAVLRTIWSVRTYRLVAVATACQAAVGYGFGPFLASFFVRNHGPEITQLAARAGIGVSGFLGLALGLSIGLAGAIGVWLGGHLADRYGRRDVRAYVTIPALASLAALPCYAVIFSMSDGRLALVALAIPNILGAMWMGPIHSTHQSVMPAQIRGGATALFLLVLNIVGVGLGPLLVGALSDLLSWRLGYDPGASLRASLILTSLMAPLAALLFWRARMSIEFDFKR